MLDEVTDEKDKWIMTGARHGASLLIIICNKNAHSTRASAIVAKTELLSV